MPDGKKRSEKGSKATRKPISLREQVAARAGVSVFTVQRVFATPQLVHENTRSRVLQVAAALGYSPNLAGRALSTGRTGTIALVLLTHRLSGESLADTFSGFYHALAPRGLDVLTSVVPDDTTPEAWMQRLVAGKRCDAIAIHEERLASSTLETIQTLRVPVTLLYYPVHGRASKLVSSVTFDNRSGIQQAVRHLAALGHRSIGYLGGNVDWGDSADREQGYRAAMEALRLPVRAQWVGTCDFEHAAETAMEAFHRMFALDGPKPSAFVCASDWMASGVAIAARRWGLSVPGDLSVTGFDNALWSQFHYPPLTTVKYSGRLIGEEAARTLLERLDDPHALTRSICLPTSLVVRESTAPPPRA